MGAEGFRELRAWQAAKELAVLICFASESGPLSRDFGLRDQLRRSAVSVPSNIAEGDERDTNKDSVRFLYIAKGSLAELRTQLEIASEIGALPHASVKSLLDSAAALARQLGAFIKARSPRA